MTATRDGARRRYPGDILPRDQAEQAAAKVAARVVELTIKGLADPEHGWHFISDARALAQIGTFLCGYVAMLEKGS